MYKHAQLDENGVVVGISFLAGIVTAENMVFLDGSRENDDIADLGWRLVDGEWHEPEPAPAPAPEPESPATVEELKEFMLLNMQLTLEALEQINEMKGGAEDV